MTTSTNAERFHNWGDHPMPGRSPQAFHLGPLTLWCSTLQNEVWIAFEASTEGAADEPDPTPASEPIEDLTWTRWALHGAETTLRLTPEFPDRSLIVKPDYAFNLSPEAEARIYVHCPVWCKVEAVGERTTLITEIPTETLSNTWFGTFTNGELCYWLSTTARRSLEDATTEPNQAVCPVRIRNRSSEELQIEKLCLRIRALSIYKDDQRMWSDETTISFRGGVEFSRIEVAGVPPRESAQAQPFSSPRDPGTRSLMGKTFASIKDLSEFPILTR